MMERIRRITAVTLIAALMVTALASCKKAEITEEDVYVYVPEYINLPKDIQHMDNPQYFDGKLYFTAHIVTGKDSYTDSYTGEKHEYDITEQRLCSINTDGTGFAELAGYEAEKTPDWLPEGVEGNMYINRIALDTEGNIWISESGSFWYYDLPEDFDESKDEMWQYYVDYGNVNSLRKLDRTGAETATIDLSVITGDSGGGYGVGGGGVIMRPMSASSVRTAPSAGMRDRYFYMSGLNVDNDGNVYVCDGNTSVYVFDSSGVLLFKMDTEDYYPEMLVRLGDGRMAVSL
ncbi:MAG: hypothetical protein FWG32_03935, partial [Oscillospiraceae bacterium]|nr:hypothetical protein [Oscillospiraceae bacterium]